jgi:hypothetical protein
MDMFGATAVYPKRSSKERDEANGRDAIFTQFLILKAVPFGAQLALDVVLSANLEARRSRESRDENA